MIIRSNLFWFSCRFSLVEVLRCCSCLTIISSIIKFPKLPLLLSYDVKNSDSFVCFELVLFVFFFELLFFFFLFYIKLRNFIPDINNLQLEFFHFRLKNIIQISLVRKRNSHLELIIFFIFDALGPICQLVSGT